MRDIRPSNTYIVTFTYKDKPRTVEVRAPNLELVIASMRREYGDEFKNYTIVRK